MSLKLRLGLSLGLGLGFKKINDELLNIDPFKQQAIVRQLGKGGGGSQQRGFSRLMPLNPDELFILASLYGMPKKKYVKELRAKYESRRYPQGYK